MSAIPGTYPLTVFFDGDCPICAREISIMKRLNRAGSLEFVDFSSDAYDPSTTGLSPSELGRVIHARWSDGTLITGVDVFRAMWTGVGLGWLARLSRIGLFDRLLMRAYEWFSRNRLWLTGRTRGARQPDEDGSTPCERCGSVTGRKRG